MNNGNIQQGCDQAQDLRGLAGPRDYAQPLPKFPITATHNPTMGAKLSKVAEIFELDIIDEAEALKACKTIIEQHTKVKGKTEPGLDVKVK